MTDQADQLQVPTSTAGCCLLAVRSQYGDYFDFELLWPSSINTAVVGVISGYACSTRIYSRPDGSILTVGNTSVFLPTEQAKQLAAFLGIEVMADDLMHEQSEEIDDE